MAHGRPDYTTLSSPAGTDYGEGQVVWFQSEAVSVASEDSEDLFNYVVPDGHELRICSGVVFCEIPRTQRYQLITIPAGSWVSPTSHIDSDSLWSNEGKAYDKDLNSYAYTFQVDNHYLELLLSIPITCSKVRIYAAKSYPTTELQADPDLDIDVYYDGAWHNIFSGLIIKQTWVEKTFTEKTVTKARIKFTSLGTFYKGRLYEFEFDMTAETPTPPPPPLPVLEGVFFDTCALVPLTPQSPYPVVSGNTFSVRVYNDDELDCIMGALFGGFLQAKS